MVRGRRKLAPVFRQLASGRSKDFASPAEMFLPPGRNMSEIHPRG
jgi:hypothetical protein